MDGDADRQRGKQVRILDVPADAGASLGLFEHLHGFASADVFARHLKSASASCHGTAGRAFLDSILGDLEGVRYAVSGHLKGFVAAHIAGGADGQVNRAAQRFGLIAAGGELAVTAGVLPWPEGEATRAAARCYQDWISARGGYRARRSAGRHCPGPRLPAGARHVALRSCLGAGG
jgi:uncharacterized protein (DUF927 family)